MLWHGAKPWETFKQQQRETFRQVDSRFRSRVELPAALTFSFKRETAASGEEALDAP